MRIVITSDIHIGSRHCRRDAFLHFLEVLPDDASLVLNGDSVNRPDAPLCPEDQRVIDTLVKRAAKTPVIWVWGNHDDGYRVPGETNIRYQSSFAVGNRLFAAHGHEFDDVMPRHQFFMRCFRHLHRIRVTLGAPPVHVAQYAKKWSLLFNYLRRNVRRAAVAYAKRHGYSAVACGHVHWEEDSTEEEIRYLNTGAWTEEHACCILVDENDISLIDADRFA